MKAARSLSSRLFSQEVVESPVPVKKRPLDEAESCGESCVLILLILALAGLVCVCVGSGLYATNNTSERDIRIGQLASSIKTWKSGKDSSHLASGNFSVNITTTGCANPSSSCPCYNGSYPMKVASAPPDNFTDAADQLPKYKQLRLVFNGTKELGWEYPQSAGAECVLSARVKSGAVEVAAVQVPFVARLPTVIADTFCPAALGADITSSAINAQNCRNACDKVAGAFSSMGISYTCDAPYVTSRACIRVARSKDGSFQEVAGVEGRGCYPLNGRVKRPLTLSKQIYSVSEQLLSVNLQEQVPAVVLEVRSDMDPWIQYMDKTKGRLQFNFHLNQEARKGVILMAVGGLLSLLWFPLCYFCWKWVCSARRYDCPMGMWGAVYDGTHRLSKRMGYDVEQHYMGPGRNRNNPLFCPVEREMREEAKTNVPGGRIFQSLSAYVRGGRSQKDSASSSPPSDVETGQMGTLVRGPSVINVVPNPPRVPPAKDLPDAPPPQGLKDQIKEAFMPPHGSPDSMKDITFPEFPKAARQSVRDISFPDFAKDARLHFTHRGTPSEDGRSSSTLNIQVGVDEDLMMVSASDSASGTASDSPSSGEGAVAGGSAGAAPSASSASATPSPETTQPCADVLQSGTAKNGGAAASERKEAVFKKALGKGTEHRPGCDSIAEEADAERGGEEKVVQENGSEKGTGSEEGMQQSFGRESRKEATQESGSERESGSQEKVLEKGSDKVVEQISLSGTRSRGRA